MSSVRVRTVRALDIWRGHPASGDLPAQNRGQTPHPILCGTDLSGAEVVRLPAKHPAFAAQSIIRTVIATGVGGFGVYATHPQQAAVVLADVRAVARRTLSYAAAVSGGRQVPQGHFGHQREVLATGAAGRLDGDTVRDGGDVARQHAGVGIGWQVAFVDRAAESISQSKHPLVTPRDEEVPDLAGRRPGERVRPGRLDIRPGNRGWCWLRRSLSRPPCGRRR
jgi:hypothetical protein